VPALGDDLAVVVRDGEVVAEGWHVRPGEPHAEAVALEAAGGRARGATCYVNLEPCPHFGRTCQPSATTSPSRTTTAPTTGFGAAVRRPRSASSKHRSRWRSSSGESTYTLAAATASARRR